MILQYQGLDTAVSRADTDATVTKWLSVQYALAAANGISPHDL